MLKREDRSEVQASGNSPSCDSNADKHVEADCEMRKLEHKRSAAADAQASGSNAYFMAEKLFYCQRCNFGHPTPQGVLMHQSKKHRGLNTTAAVVFNYTEIVRKSIKQSIQKSQSQTSPFSSHGLPLPLLYEGDEDKLFCPVCNFGQRSLASIIKHQRIRHPGLMIHTNKIVEYSAMVHEQTQKSRLETTTEQAVKHTSLEQSGTEKAQISHPGNSMSVLSPSSKMAGKMPPSFKIAAKIRSFKCHKCIHATPHVYLLRKHLRTIHKTRHTAQDVLRMAFDTGILQEGYHCEWCVFSHKEAVGLHRHCQEIHASRGISLEHITAQLYVGPKASASKKKQPRLKNASDTDNCPKTSPSQASGNVETRTYPCRACSFKGSSPQSITSHYRAVHPWSVKEDGSVISRKALIVNRQAQDAEAHHELGNESLDSCQVPLEHETLPRLSPHQATASKSYKCHLCVAVFNTQRGLDIHYGMKHPKYIQKPDTLQEVKLPASKHGLRVCVYKCPRCTYVNTSPHGVLTHCQMRHPVFIARAEKLQTDEAQLPNMNECVKKKGPNDRLRYGGYMCKICPLIRASLKKLKSHYEQDHNQAVSNMLKPIPKHSTVIKKQLKFKYQSAQSTVLQAAFSKNKTAGTTCPICKYVCNSKSGLSRHLHIHNRKVAEANEDGVYKCSMCSYSSYMQKYLAQHYERKHAKPGFLAYIVPVDAQIDKTSKPALLDHETRHLENTSETCQSNTPATENKSLVRKCRLCPYSTSIHKHLASHYRKTHGHAAFKKHFVPVCKQQQSTKCKDNKVGNLPKVESERSPSVQCKKCKSSFNSSQLLSVHYTRFHRSDIRVDFTVLSGTSGSGSEGYQCGHCNVKIKSTMKLCSHLDHHRELYGEKANAVKMNTPLVSEKPAETKPVKLQRQVELPEFQTVHELARWNVTKVETFILAASPPASPSKTPEREEPEMESAGAKGHTCKQCGRTFMSLTGLRVHEHSHAAMAALEARSTSSSKEIVDKYTSYSSGTFKPFRCGICSYRTAIMGLLRSHLMKKHSAECPDIAECFAETADQDKKTTLREDKDPPLSVDLQESDCSTEPHESGTIKKPFYFEPLAVQRQLNHYRQVAQASGPSALCETKPSEDSLIHCEYCNFSTEHLSSVRRHYFNRHGKKLLRCKDCCFFTGLRKTMELHQETGHSNCPSEPTHQKDLRCPFCLYQTKNKNNMIDHIILHREERMVPIEVRRPKLSRYLQGIVFRCHRCTFTSASDENLRLHIQKHDDIKPYKCRLCYFDCAQLSELEAHLCDKHQVIRNHELVGQVNLNQMGARVGKVSEEEEERSPSQQGTDEDEDMETEIQQEGEVKNMLEPSNVTHENQERQDPNSEEHVKQNEVLHQDQEESLTENDLGKNVPEQNEEPRLNQGQDNEEENAETEVNGTAVALADMENQEDQAEDDMFTADNTDGREMERNIEPNVDDGDRDKMISEEGRVKQERDLDENRAQHELRGSKEDVERNHSTQGQETVQASLTENSNMSEAAQACELHKKSVQDAKVVEQLEDNLLHEILELDEGGSFALSHDLQEARKQLVMRDVERQNHTLAKVIGARDCSTVEGHLLAVPCHKNRGGEDGSDVSFTSCEGKRARGQKSTRELADLYGEMPLLENEYLKEEMQSHGSQTEMHKEEEWSDSLEGSNEQEQVKGDEKIDEENTNQCTIWKHEGVEQTKEADSPFLPNGAFAAMDGDDGGVFLLSNDDKLFACKLCGRNFIDDTELERHIMRHGM
ncbi:zinc finger protein 462-like [Polymixia lowei]